MRITNGVSLMYGGGDGSPARTHSCPGHGILVLELQPEHRDLGRTLPGDLQRSARSFLCASGKRHRDQVQDFRQPGRPRLHPGDREQRGGHAPGRPGLPRGCGMQQLGLPRQGLQARGVREGEPRGRHPGILGRGRGQEEGPADDGRHQEGHLSQVRRYRRPGADTNEFQAAVPKEVVAFKECKVEFVKDPITLDVVSAALTVGFARELPALRDDRGPSSP